MAGGYGWRMEDNPQNRLKLTQKNASYKCLRLHITPLHAIISTYWPQCAWPSRPDPNVHIAPVMSAYICHGVSHEVRRLDVKTTEHPRICPQGKLQKSLEKSVAPERGGCCSRGWRELLQREEYSEIVEKLLSQGVGTLRNHLEKLQKLP